MQVCPGAISRVRFKVRCVFNRYAPPERCLWEIFTDGSLLEFRLLILSTENVEASCVKGDSAGATCLEWQKGSLDHGLIYQKVYDRYGFGCLYITKLTSCAIRILW